MSVFQIIANDQFGCTFKSHMFKTKELAIKHIDLFKNNIKNEYLSCGGLTITIHEWPVIEEKA